ncbi:ent-kaurene synthase TSP4, chloroplastic isoform X1 [Andrographis paniculata]|uniref:Kaurene synthase 1 n=2 Tax=Andrographis paniculata TaxID=175694 RepID=A0A2R4LWC7_ANDPA|nr:ent-kaurene synthase TSP4, chloroplastic isoform X1 [Andrographis paniculata]AVW89186.1 kaurene synthase 1 [Andrographis paniculata]UYR28654.1 kaurene synthase 1 [Andrographis alata]
MSLQLSASVCFGRKETHYRSCFSRVSASLEIEVRSSPKVAAPYFEKTKERIATLLNKAEVSVSTYDTAWVAMVPSPHSSLEPCFPDSLKWLLENQCPDGSWARPHHHHLLQKDVLSSTLACVLALKKWGTGEEHINRGLHYLESNFASAMEKNQFSPLGFDIIFPTMVEYARDMFLNLNLEPTTLNALIYKRSLQLERCKQSRSLDRDAYMGYISEGMGKLQNWESIMKYQRKNGSLFNSPSATAAAFIGLPNDGCLRYLRSALKEFGNAVPAVYPLDIYLKLCVVDNLDKQGISCHFTKDIQGVLDETYRLWLQGNEDIFLDASTCALAFRLLRKNGYDITSDRITKILKEYHSSGYMKDTYTTVELYKASEYVMNPDERDLDEQYFILKGLLEVELSSGFIYSNQLGRNIDLEVSHALKHPFYATLDRMEKLRNIEHYNPNSTRIAKTSFCSPCFGNSDFLSLSTEDFNKCQAIQRKELKELERWVVENRLEELKFARQKAAYCYFSAAATLPDPKLSDARMSWAKNGVLTTVVDDFFDVGGSLDELKQLIWLIEEIWDADSIPVQFASSNVQIIYTALKHTICEIGDKGFIIQGYNVKNHVAEIWLDLLKSMMKETEWTKDKTIPSVEEYMSNAYVSFALGPIVLPALYLVGPKLSEEMVQHSEYHKLFKLMSTCGRLLNDIRGCEREMNEGKLNAVPLYVRNSGGKTTKEEAIFKVKCLIDSNRRELLKLVLDAKNSVIPKPCKDLFWHMCTVVHLFYSKDDGFTSPDLIKEVKAVLFSELSSKDNPVSVVR